MLKTCFILENKVYKIKELWITLGCMFIKDTTQLVFYDGNIVSEINSLYDDLVYKSYNIRYFRKDIIK